MSTGENDVVVRAWNGVLFDKFVRFKHLLVEGLAAHSDEALSRGLFEKGDRSAPPAKSSASPATKANA